MAASIQQNTENARETEKISRKAAKDIEESSKAVGEDCYFDEDHRRQDFDHR